MLRRLFGTSKNGEKKKDIDDARQRQREMRDMQRRLKTLQAQVEVIRRDQV